MIWIENDGPLIRSTNYWETPGAARGKFHVSINARTFRVLVPGPCEPAIPDMAAARECLVSRGPCPGLNLPDCFEILFDDRTPNPLALTLSPASFGLTRLPTGELAATVPSDDWIAIPVALSCWVAAEGGGVRLALEKPCWYRRVPRIPWLRPREA